MAESGGAPHILMELEHQIKQRVKEHLLSAGPTSRRIRFGIGTGISLMLDRRVHLQREFGLYESELQGAYRRYITADSVVYDVGAGDGDTALLFAKLASSGRVVAFEPEARLCDGFRKNMSLNPALAARITLVPASVGTGSASIDSYGLQTRRFPIPDFVKIDVDGGEITVLQGMASTIDARHPTILVEVHSWELERECLAYLRSVGYLTLVVKNARWRSLYPEYRPILHNRWLLAFMA